MKRRSFLHKSALVAGAVSLTAPSIASGRQVDEKFLVEWRIYHISRVPEARNTMVRYFKEALNPFLSKRKIRFAVFNDYGMDEPVKLFTMMAYPGMEAYRLFHREIETDPDFLQAAAVYNQIHSSNTPYTRYEAYLLSTFDGFPDVKNLATENGLYELRLYESTNEGAGNRKITMFNKEEIPLFLKVGLNPVFFGKILAGQNMPGLLYMVGFKNMEERDAAWGRFGNSEEWKIMQKKPEYADTVSNIYRTFLTPAHI